MWDLRSELIKSSKCEVWTNDCSDIVKKFVDEECIPADAVAHAQLGEGDQRWVSYRSTTKLDGLGLDSELTIS